MIERPQPYVGVSGVVNHEQQQELIDAFHESGLPNYGRRLLLGIKAVHKTQFLDIENKFGPEWYPIGEDQFANAVAASNDTTESANIAQLYLDANYVGDPTYRDTFSRRVIQRGAPWLNGVQFDLLPWHNDAEMLPFLERLKSEHDDMQILLQCHGEAMEQLGPDEVVRQLGRYAHILDNVLFDASHGKGVRLNTAALRPFLDAAYSSSKLASVGMVGAGGLNAAVVRDDLPQLVNEFTDLSWDTEGQMHPVNAQGKRPLDMPTVRDYFGASATVLDQVY